MRTNTLVIAGRVRIVVPDSLNLITPYVLFEQQDWFEEEISFLRRVLRDGEKAIDIGANYGVYTLSMAKAVGPNGAIWAFEPASSTAEFLKQSIAANQFEHITLECSALSDTGGSARLTLNDHAELNALEHGAESANAGETVRVTTLDDAAERYQWRDIEFLKIDAEGEETRIIQGGRDFLRKCSPLILYEVKAGDTVHLDLVRAFEAMGYESYRLVPGLEILAPFIADEEQDGFLLNLFCCKADRSSTLSKRGLLATPHSKPTGSVSMPAALNLTSLPYGAALDSTWQAASQAIGRSEIDEALSQYAASQDVERPAIDRFSALKRAFETLKRVCDQYPTHLRRASLARVASEFGARSVAIAALNQLIQTCAQGHRPSLDEPFLATTRRFETVDPNDDIDRWVLASILEALERLADYSSFYTGNAARPRLETIASLGYASDEMLRRLKLVRLRFPTPSATASE